MNKFKDTLDSLRKRPESQEVLGVLPTMPKGVQNPKEGCTEAEVGKDPEFGLPYSSDPVPIVEPWR